MEQERLHLVQKSVKRSGLELRRLAQELRESENGLVLLSELVTVSLEGSD